MKIIFMLMPTAAVWKNFNKLATAIQGFPGVFGLTPNTFGIEEYPLIKAMTRREEWRANKARYDESTSEQGDVGSWAMWTSFGIMLGIVILQFIAGKRVGHNKSPVCAATQDETIHE